MISIPAVCPEFIGRRDALAHLHAQLEKATGAQTVVTLIAGEAGIGKTRLLNEFLEAAPPGTLVAVGRCAQFLPVPYLPLIDAFKALAAGAQGRTLRAELEALIEHWEALEPQEQYQRAASFGGHLAALAELAPGSPLVLAVEDLHWADAGTLRFLIQLIQRVRDVRLFVLATLRDDEPVFDQALLAAATASLARAGGTRIELPRFSYSEMRRLIAACRPAGDLDSATVAALIELADGNPLFGEELVREARSGEWQTRRDRDAPTHRSMVLERLARLSQDDQTVLRAAAVSGRTVDVTLLSEILGREPASVAATLERARDVALLRREHVARRVRGVVKDPIQRSEPASPHERWLSRDPTGAGRLANGKTASVPEERVEERFVFHHMLTREHLYRSSSEPARREMHRLLASQLERSVVDAIVVGTLAYHWSRAGDRRKALEYNERAGDLAARAYAIRDAWRFYSRAFENAPAAGPRHAALCEKLAYAAYLIGRDEEALELYRAAADEHRRLDEPEARVFALLRVAYQCAYCCDGDRYHATVDEALAEASTLTESALTPYLFIAKAEGLSSAGEFAAANAFMEQAAVRLRATGRDPERDVNYQSILAPIALALGDGEEAFTHSRAGAELGDQGENTSAAVSAYCVLGSLSLRIGAFASAFDALDRANELASTENLPIWSAYVLVQLVEAHLFAGNLSHSLGYLHEYEAIGVESAFIRAQAAPLAITLGLRLLDDALIRRYGIEATLELAFASRDSRQIARSAAAFVELLRHQGLIQQGAGLLGRAVGYVRHGAEAPELLIAVADWGNEAAREGARDLLEIAAKDGANRLSGALLPLFDAIVARRRRSRRASSEHAHRAAVALEKIGARLYAARAWELALRRPRALDLLAACGERRDSRRIEGELRRPNQRGRHANVLTERERQIALLAATDASNRSIAERLGISERTVEHHLSSILRRLSLKSRAQIAAHINHPP